MVVVPARAPMSSVTRPVACICSGAIVNRSKKVKMALEIETGALVSEKGVEKRVYMFTTTGTDDKVRCCPHLQPLILSPVDASVSFAGICTRGQVLH